MWGFLMADYIARLNKVNELLAKRRGRSMRKRLARIARELRASIARSR